MKKVLFFLTTLTLLSLAWGGAVKAQQTLTVYDQGGDNSNYYVPMYGGYFDENTKTEFVIPAAQLEAMNGGTITSMKFYIFSVSGDYSWASTQTVFLKEVESDQLSAYSGTDGATIVYTGQFTAPESTETEFEINFQTPYEYHGGNLLVGIYNPAGGYGHYRFVYWFGENVNGASGSGNSNSSLADVSFSQKNFIPKTTFTYEAPAGCVKPANINVTALTSSSISVGWPAGNATSWNVYLNGTLTDDSPVSSNSYTFDNLTEYEVNYTIGVSAVCGSEVSDVTTTTVLLCVPAPTSIDGTGITNVTFGGMEDVLSMTYSPYYYDHSSQIGTASPGGTVNMSIVYATNYTYYTWVWVDWNQDHTFSDEECVYPSISTISSGTLELSFNVPATVASGNYRMRIQGADYNSKKDPCYTGTYSYLVDYTLHIGEASVCLAPAGLTATNVTHEGATLTWSNPNEGGSYIIKRVDGNVETVIEDNYTSTSYPITGLVPQTDYTYRVYIKCSASDVSDYEEVSFSTTAPATAVGDYWSDDFEGTEFGWELINGTLTNAWVWGEATSNGGTHSLYISKDGGATNTYSEANTKVFAAKLLNFTESKYTFEYDWLCYGEKNYDFLRVALVPASTTLTAGEDYYTIDDESLPTGWIALDGGGQLNESTSWQNKSVAINVAAGNYYLVLAWRNDVTAYDPPAAVDNVSITKIACEYLVEGVQVINSTVTTSTANVLWGASEATAWQVQTKAGNGEWTTLSSSDVDFSLSGVKEIAYLRNLTPGTEYQVRVRANCGNEQYGAWSNVISFTTECAPRAVTNDNKFTANFDDMTGSTYPSENNLPICWNYINTCSYATYSLYPYVYWSSNESNSGANHLRFHSLASAEYTYIIPKPQYAILPPMQDVSNLRIKFYARAYNIGTDYDATFKVGVLTNPNDASTFTEIATYTPATTTYELYTIPFNTYSGNGNYIAIMIDAAEVPASGDFHRMLFIDDITVEPIPECVVPTNLRTVSVAHDGATVKWAANLEESWNLKYHAQGENQWIEVNGLQDSTYTFTELNAETEYEWQVQAACGANLTSDWSSLGTFTTEAEPQVTCHEWQLVTSANDLHDGDQIIIAASGNYNVAMSTTQKDNNRDVATIIKDGNKLTLPVGDDVQVLTANYLATNDAWTLYTGEGYLYAASSSSNLLRTEEEIDEYGNAYWTITFSNGVASIVANGNNSRKIMKYNNNSRIISCYASGQSPLAIYRLIDNRRLATKDTTVAHALPFIFTMAGQPDTIITSYGEFNLSYVIEADPVNCDSVLNVHLTVNEPMFTVTLEAGAGTIALPTPLTGNSTHPVDLANLVPELDNNCTEWTFAGWSSAAVAETNDAPDFVTTISPTSDTTLYAVYVKSEGGSGDAIWQKANTIAIGDQMVLVYETGKYELSGISTTSTKYGERVSYSVAPTGVYPLTVVAGTAAASYSLKTSDDNYLTWTSGNSLNKASSVTDNSSWSISFDNDGNADIANISQDTRKIRYNTGSPRFACYEGGQSAIQLYKLSNPVVNTYNSNPVCDVNYNITLIQPADGSISSDPELTASAGAVVTLTATPHAGYTFESWEVRNLSTGQTVDVVNNQFTMPAGNVEVHASFTAIEYTVTATANPAAGGTVSGAGTYSYEGAASLTASANNGYEFVNWTNEQGAVVCTTATYNFIVTRDSALTANFALKEYTITMSVVTGGTLSHNLPANVATMGTEVTLIATPDEGYQFDGDWTVQNISASSPVTVENNKFTMPAGNVTVTGYFSPITYTVSAVVSPANAGEVTGTGSYNHGDGVQLTANPAAGYEFVNWTNAQGAVVSTDADYNFIVNRDSALTANFELKEYTITMVQPNVGGTLSHNLPANVATMGTEVTLIATPDEGYQFDGDWTVQNTSASSPVTVENNKFTMPAGNVTVTGYFSYITYTVSAVVSPANAGSVTGTGSFNHGAEVQLTANPATGYEFVNWTNAQGAVVCTTATYNFNVTSDSALTANFALKEYTITYMDGNTELDVDTFAFGADVTAIADPEKECKEFAGWSETLPATMPANNIVLYAQWNDLYYNITASADPVNGGSVTFNPEPEVGTTAANSGYVCNTQVTLTATPEQEFVFVGWSVNGNIISADAQLVVSVTSDTTIEAQFEAKQKVATPTFTPVAGTYTEPKTVTIACATPGAVIYYTTDGTEPTANSTQYTDGFELNANTTVKAIAMKDGNDWLPSDVATAEYIFNFPLYTVTFIPGTNGTVTKDTMMGNAFTHPVDFTNNSAVPAADCQTLGWSFVGWSTAAVQETTTAPTTLVTSPYSPTDNITLYAVYQQDNNAAVSSSVDFSTMGYSNQTAVTTVDINNTTTATFAKANGSTAPTYYTSGTAVRCYAKNTITISSQSAMTGITFTFGSDDGQNAITADEGAYSNGVWTGNATSVTFTIGGANGNRRIATITVNQGGTVTTYNSDPDCIITYPIELATVQNGTIGADKTEAAEGETVTLNATPATGYHFGRWNVTKTATTSVENVTVTNNTFEMPASAVTVSADFWIDTLIILATPNPANGGTVTGEDEYEYGTQVTLTATPANDYYFTGWTSNGTQVSTDATFTFTATQDSDLVANFEAKQLVATPTFTPAAGSYTEPQTVTINCATQGATIYYTTDGTEPTANSTQYTDGFTLNANTTVKAIAVKDGEQWLPSEVATAAYTFNFPTYTVTFNPGNNGTVPEATMTGNQFTEPVDFTNNVPSPAAACTDWTFAGWRTAEVTETTTEPTFVTSPYNPSADITLYAVYQKTEQGTGAATPARYVKVTSAPNDWNGDYLIVCEGIWVAFDGSRSSLDANNNTIDVEINNGVIDSTATTGAAKFTIASMNTTTGYSIKSASGKYIGSTSTNKNELLSSTTTQYSNTISIDNGNAFIKGTSRYLRYNGTDGRFRYYTSSSQQDIQLYKYEPATAATVTTYNSNPVCSYMVYVDGNMQNGTVTVDPATATTDGALIGSTVTLTATPNQGYHFGYWQVSTDATYTNPVTVTNNSFEMPTSDVYVNAIFWIDTLHITATVNPAQTGSVDPSEAYVIYGDQVTLTATPAQDYLFENWTSNGQPVATDAVITITATQDSALVANFIQMDQVATPTFTSNPEGNTFTTEDVVTVTITTTTPNATIYYTMDGTDPVVPAGRNVTGTQVYEGPITLTETTTLKAVAAAENMINSEIATATYTINQMYYVDVDNSIEHGTVTADPEKGIENTQISLTAVPEEGYIFKAWNVYNANDADQTVTVTNNQFNMPAYDVMVSATFVPDTFTVTFVLNGAQFVAGYTPISRYWYKQQDANLPTAADMEYEGHSFDGWYENANFDGNSWTSVPDTAKSNKTYYAKWNVNNYGLTINYVDFNGQTVHESYSQSLDYGTGYEVASPAVDTYMPELDTVKGTMGTEAVTVNVRYAQVQMLNIDNVTVCTGETTQEINYELIPFFMEYFSGMRQGFETVIDGPMSITAGSNGIAAFTAVNDGTEPLTNTITVTPHDTLGGHTVKGVPQTFTITVNPKNVSEFSEIACDSYTWTAADTTIVDEGENDYVHVFQNQYGCDSTVTLHLNLHKTPTVVGAVDKAYYCTTENVTLNSTGSSTGSEYTYAWTGPNNYESTETNPVLASPLTGEMSGTYQLTVTHTATGCVSEPASVEVVVNTPGTPGYLFTITTPGDAYANIDGSLDEVTPVFATPEVNHFLDGANVNYTVVNNAENSYNAVGDYTITWTATDECGNEATTTQVLHVTQNVCPVATDADNNTYPSVQLAGKCWMAKNLRTTRFSDGRAVNNLMVYDNIMYPNTTENLSRYGYLYDWDNAMDAQNGTVTPDANSHVQGVCPTGWRIPNHNDFMDIAGSNSATDMYDLRYNQYWLDGGGNNSTNYSLLPGGCYNDNTGRYENLLGNAYLWGVNPASPSQPRAYWADCKCYMWQVSDTTNGMGHSVRCIKD